jgi:hypothetical protein
MSIKIFKLENPYIPKCYDAFEYYFTDWGFEVVTLDDVDHYEITVSFAWDPNHKRGFVFREASSYEYYSGSSCTPHLDSYVEPFVSSILRYVLRDMEFIRKHRDIQINKKYMRYLEKSSQLMKDYLENERELKEFIEKYYPKREQIELGVED